VTPGRVLVLNAGSATLKATVLDLPSIEPLSDRTVEWSSGTSAQAVGTTVEDVIAALDGEGIPLESIAAVGHRVVHGGERYTEPTQVGDDVLADLNGLADLAPNHQPLAIATIRAARERIVTTGSNASGSTACPSRGPSGARRTCSSGRRRSSESSSPTSAGGVRSPPSRPADPWRRRWA
jgi:acetate kinase